MKYKVKDRLPLHARPRTGMSDRMYLFQTDQYACYDEAGKIIACRGTGQDGEIRAGVPWPEPRFSREGGLVTDHLTGLVWPMDTGCRLPVTWTEAFDVAEKMSRDTAYGRAGWRLPDRSEVFSLVSHSRINPCLPRVFDNLFPGYYWTATPSERLEDQAWTVHLGGGRLVRGMKHRDAMVWPVCDLEGGAAAPDAAAGDPASRFETAGDVVTDYGTGLMWLQHPDTTGPAVGWCRAFESVHLMNRRAACGFDDWRLPNVRELESLVDLASHSPALHPEAGFTGTGLFYWSSTTSVYNPSYAWTLYTQDGTIGVGGKADPEFCVWPVRSI